MSKVYDEDCRLYLTMLQSNIERMATNCKNCKTWMITMVTAFMALESAVKAVNEWILLGLLPIVLFWYLDAFYLSLERGMRNRERNFINSVNDNKDVSSMLFNFQPLITNTDDVEQGVKATCGVWKTESVWPFYVIPMVVLILLYIAIAFKFCI